MKAISSFALAAVAGLSAGCAGGATRSALPATPANVNPATPAGPPAPGTASIRIHFGGTTSSSAARTPQFVSSGINGIEIDASVANTQPQPHFFDLSRTSPLCSPNASIGGRDCTLLVPSPVASSVIFAAKTYDQVPTTTGFAATANVLSVGGTTAAVSLSAANTFTITLEGVLAPHAGTIRFAQFDPTVRGVVDGNVASNPILHAAGFDAAGQQITADAFGFDPVTLDGLDVAIADGLQNHTSFPSFGQTVQFTSGPNASGGVFMAYDGKGSPGDQTSEPYHATMSATSDHTKTVLESNVLFTPLFVVLPTAVNPDSTVTFRLAEFGQGGRIAKAQLNTNCVAAGYSAADLTPQSSAPPFPTFSAATSTNFPEAVIFTLVVGGARNGACDITFSDADGNSVTRTFLGALGQTKITIPNAAHRAVQ